MTDVLHYVDPVDGFSGWLVYDGMTCRLSVGGCRVRSGLTAETLTQLAGRMTLKERLLGINVEGAKCGIDLDPASPTKDAALRRFLSFLRPHLMSRFSAGCDMGTRWGELERLAALEGIYSIKYAVKGAQELSDDEFFTRLRTLDKPIGLLTLAQRRAGHALAHAALGAARAIGLATPLTCSLQGFGNLGRSAAYSLLEEGARITAIADVHGCVRDDSGLDVARMLASPYDTPVPLLAANATRLPREALFDAPVDVVVLAGSENAMTMQQAADSTAPLVAVGANCGLSPEVERHLHEAGVCVIPDFVGGIGGSASMEALFGPAGRPSPDAVLDGVAGIVRELVDDLIDSVRRRGISMRDAAMERAAAAVVSPGDRPYGCSPYVMSKPHATIAGGVS